MALSVAALCIACGAWLLVDGVPWHDACDVPQTDSLRVTFRPIVVLPATPVKDQGRSPLCWLYAMQATIETEHLVQGDSVNLSPLYNARRYMERLAIGCHLDPQHAVPSLRGMATMTLHLLDADGAMPYDSYWQDRPLNMNAAMRRMATAASRRAPLALTRRAMTGVADEMLGYLPTHIYMLGAEYSTRDFAQSVCLPLEWRALTSVTHHPFYHDVVLELPDNRMGDAAYNVPIDVLMNRLVASIRAGHPVCWEGDISEPGFDWPRGVADLPPHTTVTQRERQRQIELLRTTDDHCLCLTGLFRGSDGQLWFLAKNSWGTANVRGGYMLLSWRYVRMKTLVAVVRDFFLSEPS